MRRIFNLLHKVVILLAILAVIIEDETVKRAFALMGLLAMLVLEYEEDDNNENNNNNGKDEIRTGNVRPVWAVREGVLRTQQLFDRRPPLL